MRILVFTPYFSPHPGGSQHYIQELYRRLRLMDKNVKVDLICYNTDQDKKKTRIDGITVYRVGCLELLPGQFAVPNYLELFELLKSLKKNRYDVVNSHTRFFDNSWWTPWVAKYLGAKSVLTDHCAYHPQHSFVVVQKLAKIIDRLFVKIISPRYDAITSISESTKKFLHSLGTKGEIAVFTAGIPEIRTRNKNRVIPKINREVAKDEIIISFVGRLIPAKKAQLLANIAAYFPTKVQFIIAGTGPLLSELQEMNNANLHVLGKLDRDEVEQLLQCTDIFIHPSTHSEGLPLVLLEAAAAGCAIVATPQGETTQLITSHKTGVLINSNQSELLIAVKYLITHRQERQRFGKNVKQLVAENYNWPKTVKNWQQFLQQLSSVS